MNTKLLMTITALLLGATGIALTFMPAEIAGQLNLTPPSYLILQILGALYFGFAILNWMAKANLIGGIYSRPVAIGNFTHFLIGGLALIKIALHSTSTCIWIGTVCYLLFALLFGYVLFTGPSLQKMPVSNE